MITILPFPPFCCSLVTEPKDRIIRTFQFVLNDVIFDTGGKVRCLLFSCANSAKSSLACLNPGGGGGGGGVLYISLGREVRQGPSYPDPV